MQERCIHVQSIICTVFKYSRSAQSRNCLNGQLNPTCWLLYFINLITVAAERGPEIILSCPTNRADRYHFVNLIMWPQRSAPQPVLAAVLGPDSTKPNIHLTKSVHSTNSTYKKCSKVKMFIINCHNFQISSNKYILEQMNKIFFWNLWQNYEIFLFSFK